jgi:hypothetical protein
MARYASALTQAKVLKEVGPALGMLSFDEAALVRAVNAQHPISIEANNSVNRA